MFNGTIYNKKKVYPIGYTFFHHLLLSEAVAAINRTVVARFERNLAGRAARCADSVIHLAGAAGAAGVALPSVTAGLAALRFVRKTFFGEKLLLAGSKSEFLSAILADEGLVVVHEIPRNLVALLTHDIIVREKFHSVKQNLLKVWPPSKAVLVKSDDLSVKGKWKNFAREILP